MKEENVEQSNGLGNVITKSEAFIEKNQKNIIIVVAAIVIVVLGYFGLKKFYFQPREAEAMEEMFVAENWFANDMFEQALNGNDDNLGFAGIIDDYSCTKAGNLARYYAGACALRMGKYQDAINYLKKYKGKDTFTTILATMMTADAELELGNTEKAIKLYEKVVKDQPDNFVTAPTALSKAGRAYLMLNQNDKAKACFEQIKKDYPESTERQDVDKYIGYAENMSK